MKLVLSIASIGSDPRVIELCRRVTESAHGRRLFDLVHVVDSQGNGTIEQWIDDRDLGHYVAYHGSRRNLGSAGNLARRLEIGADLGADYLFAINHDGDLRFDVVETLLTRAGETPCAALYPLSELAPGVYDLTGLQPFPTRPVRRRGDQLPDQGLVEVSWSCSNGALYSLAPVRAGLRPPTGLWHGQEDLAWGLMLGRAGHRQFVDLSARIEMRYEMRPVSVLGRSRLVSDKEAWLSYYFARNLLLVALWYVPRPSFVLRAIVRLGVEIAATLAVRPAKARRLRLLAQGVLDGLMRRTGLVVPPPAPKHRSIH